MKASEIIASVATKAQAANGAWVKQSTNAGDVEACAVKKHFGGSPFASFSTNYRLNGKRIALAKLLAALAA